MRTTNYRGGKASPLATGKKASRMAARRATAATADFDVWADEPSEKDRGHQGSREPKWPTATSPQAVRKARLKGDRLAALVAVPGTVAALDLDFTASSGRMLPSAFHVAKNKAKSANELIVPVELLQDGRLLDALGHTYLIGAIAAQTEKSIGRLVVTFEQGRPTQRWVKQIPLTPEGNVPAEVLREVDMMLRAESPLTPHTILVGEGMAHLIMPLMSGNAASLSSSLKQLQLSDADGEHKSTQVLLTVADQLLRGLAGLHEKNIFHRDIKPGNLLFSADSIESLVTLADFDLAHEGKRADSDFSTYNYLAPFQWRGRPTSSAKLDVYAAGVTLFELFTGHKPLLSEAIDLLINNTRVPATIRNQAFHSALEHYDEAWLQMKRFGEANFSGPAPDLGNARWNAAFSRLFHTAPKMTHLIVAMMAPEAAQLPTARHALDYLKKEVGPEVAAAALEAPGIIESFDRQKSARTLAETEDLVLTMNDHIKTNSTHFDELGLDNQPVFVETKEQARQHILKLSAELNSNRQPSYKIQYLPAVHEVVRIRDLNVRVR